MQHQPQKQLEHVCRYAPPKKIYAASVPNGKQKPFATLTRAKNICPILCVFEKRFLKPSASRVPTSFSFADLHHHPESKEWQFYSCIIDLAAAFLRTLHVSGKFPSVFFFSNALLQTDSTALCCMSTLENETSQGSTLRMLKASFYKKI